MNTRSFAMLAALGALAVACGGNNTDPQTPASAPNSTATAGNATATSGSPGAAGAPKAPEGEQLGELETKRMVENIKGLIQPQKDRFKTMCGFDAEVEVDWASFGHDKAALGDMYGNTGVQLLVDAFEPVCKDKAGKDAVKAKVKKIRAVRVGKDAVKATISSGTFTAELNWGGSSRGMNTNDLSTAITKAL